MLGQRMRTNTTGTETVCATVAALHTYLTCMARAPMLDSHDPHRELGPHQVWQIKRQRHPSIDMRIAPPHAERPHDTGQTPAQRECELRMAPDTGVLGGCSRNRWK